MNFKVNYHGFSGCIKWSSLFHFIDLSNWWRWCCVEKMHTIMKINKIIPQFYRIQLLYQHLIAIEIVNAWFIYIYIIIWAEVCFHFNPMENVNVWFMYMLVIPSLNTGDKTRMVGSSLTLWLNPRVYHCILLSKTGGEFGR